MLEDILRDVSDDDKAIELVKKHNRINKFYGLSDLWRIQRMLTPKAQYKYAYVLLDTNNTAQELSGDKYFGWNVINYVSQQRGTISTVSNIRDLVGMRIFPVTMKLIAPVGETGKTYSNKVTNINNNFTILIHEFQAQSYVGRDGRKFHFSLFPALMNPIYFDLGTPSITPEDPYFEFTTSGKCNGWFWFRKPITEFSTMTISIGNPFDLVKPSANNTRTLIPLQLVYMSEKTD
jgi:hypothetical protein